MLPSASLSTRIYECLQSHLSGYPRHPSCFYKNNRCEARWRREGGNDRPQSTGPCGLVMMKRLHEVVFQCATRARSATSVCYTPPDKGGRAGNSSLADDLY